MKRRGKKGRRGKPKRLGSAGEKGEKEKEGNPGIGVAKEGHWGEGIVYWAIGCLV